VLATLVVALVVVALFGAMELGLLSLLSGDSAGAGSTNTTVAAGATESTAPVTSGSGAPTTTARAATTTLLASTTTTTAAPVAVPFSLVLKAKEDVWVEFRDAASGEALFVGMVAKDESKTLDAAGPVNAVVGKPGALSLRVEGRSVEPPNSFRWLVSSTGAEDRP